MHQDARGHRTCAEDTCAVRRPRVVAVITEHAGFVRHDVLQHASVHRQSAVAAWRKTRADPRSIDEVEIRRAGAFVEAEWHLENATANLHGLELSIVEIDVAPLARTQLVLDLKVDVFHPPINADATAGDIESPVLVAPDGRFGFANIPLKPRAEVGSQPVAGFDGCGLRGHGGRRQEEQEGQDQRHVRVNAAETMFEHVFRTAGSALTRAWTTQHSQSRQQNTRRNRSPTRRSARRTRSGRRGFRSPAESWRKWLAPSRPSRSA